MDDVLAGVRDAFLDEGVDEQVLQDLRQMWEAKVVASKAVDPPEIVEPPAPVLPVQLPEPSETPKTVQQKQSNRPESFLYCTLCVQFLILRNIVSYTMAK